jgi:hypothetical protein
MDPNRSAASKAAWQSAFGFPTTSFSDCVNACSNSPNRAAYTSAAGGGSCASACKNNPGSFGSGSTTQKQCQDCCAQYQRTGCNPCQNFGCSG